MSDKNIDEKLNTVKITPDTESHLRVEEDVCRNCEKKVCLYVCPAKVYKEKEADGAIIVNYENCLECGTCRVACDKINWSYPRAKYGVSFKQG